MWGVVGALLGLIGIAVAIGIPLFVEAKKRPVLRVERADDADASQRTPPFRIVHVKVINEPLGGWLGKYLLREVAIACKVGVTFTSRSNATQVAVAGRWSGTPQPLSFVQVQASSIGVVFDQTKVPQTLRFDLSPDPVGEVLGIAIKAGGDAEAFAFTSDSYQVLDTLRLPSLSLPDEEYDVLVTAQSGGIEATRIFVLYNRGTQATGLELARP